MPGQMTFAPWCGQRCARFPDADRDSHRHKGSRAGNKEWDGRDTTPPRSQARKRPPGTVRVGERLRRLRSWPWVRLYYGVGVRYLTWQDLRERVARVEGGQFRMTQRVPVVDGFRSIAGRASPFRRGGRCTMGIFGIRSSVQRGTRILRRQVALGFIRCRRWDRVPWPQGSRMPAGGGILRAGAACR